MRPVAMDYADGRTRIWTHNDNLCCVVTKGDSYVGSVNYSKWAARVVLTVETLEEAIDRVNEYAEEYRFNAEI